MESSSYPALLMCAKPCVRACAIAFLIPIAQLALFRALLKTFTKTQSIEAP